MLIDLLKLRRLVFLYATTLLAVLITACSRPANTPEKQPKAVTFSDIAFIYHGAALDRDLRAIPLDRKTVSDMLDSMVSAISAPRPQLELPDGTIRPAQKSRFSAQSFAQQTEALQKQGGDPLFAKIALLRFYTKGLPPSEAGIYAERLAVLREALSAMPGVQQPQPTSQLQEMLASLGPGLNAADYLPACRAAGVPIPPNWPDPAWTDQGALPPQSTFASFPGTVTSEVFTYQPADGSGVCYALPRKSATGSIEALGVICQARASGKACFFDNLDASGNRITGQSVAMDFSKIQNGYVLEENCTGCHRGGNVFMIHPKTPLGAIRNRNPDVRYTPIGQATWDNPPALAEEGNGACAECHEIAAPNAAYCSFLKKASNIEMPSPTAVAGWDNPRAEYKAHIDFLKTKCP